MSQFFFVVFFFFLGGGGGIYSKIDVQVVAAVHVFPNY